MNLMRFLLQSSRSIVILSGIAGGTGWRRPASRLIAARSMRAGLRAACGLGQPGRSVLRALRGLGRGAGRSAQIAMVKIGQGAIAELSLHLVRDILVLPLQGVSRETSTARFHLLSASDR